MKFNSTKIFLFLISPLLIIFFVLNSCSKEIKSKEIKSKIQASKLSHAQEMPFKSTWKTENNRTWIGDSFWSTPLEYWRINEGRVEFIGDLKGETFSPLKSSLYYIEGEVQEKGKVNINLSFGASKKMGCIALSLGLKNDSGDYRGTILRPQEGIIVQIDLKNQVLILGSKKVPFKEKSAKFFLEASINNHASKNKSSLKITLYNLNKSTALASLEEEYSSKDLSGMLSLNVFKERKPSDTLFWFEDFEVSGSGFLGDKSRNFGPIYWAMHTLSKDILKMTVQMAPIGKKDNQSVHLSLKEEDGSWKRVQTKKIRPRSFTTTFEVRDWDSTATKDYRVEYELLNNKYKKTSHFYKGKIRKEPINKRKIKLASLNCYKDYLFPNASLVDSLKNQDPDLLFFAGDQLYEDAGEYSIIRVFESDSNNMPKIEMSIKNYLGKLAFWGWTFREVMKNVPTICLPDDHDVYQGNIWGEGGKALDNIKYHEKGGFAQHSLFVIAVQDTLFSHHPAPFDPRPIKGGIQVTYGDFVYGRISFGIIEDRKFKSGPQGKVDYWHDEEDRKSRPDHVQTSQDGKFDPKDVDIAGLTLLGDRQLKFLKQWAGNWKGVDMKCLLSQTIFCNLATLHGSRATRLLADLDSNGWPQAGRKKALKEIRKSFAIHLAGDQHLPTIVQYGLEDFNDANFVFVAPAITTGYPRRLIFDKYTKVNKLYSSKNTGEIYDGFNNLMTVHAIGNPTSEMAHRKPNTKKIHKLSYNKIKELENDYSSGYGIVVFDKKNKTYTVNSYGLFSDKKQMKGWPLTIKMEDNYNKKSNLSLGKISISGLKNTTAVVKVINEKNDELVYALRLRKNTFLTKVFEKNTSYTLIVEDPDLEEKRKVFKNLKPKKNNKETIKVNL